MALIYSLALTSLGQNYVIRVGAANRIILWYDPCRHLWRFCQPILPKLLNMV
jgi:predicted LPLAT superfamily acyltransferase